MSANIVNFGGKTIRAAILAEDNTLVGDIAKDSTLENMADQQAAQHDEMLALQTTVKYFADILAQLGFTVDPTSGRMRITVEAGTLPSVTTVATVTSVTNVGGIGAQGLVFDIMQDTWANCIRGRIT
jgi:hypothetical protein